MKKQSSSPRTRGKQKLSPVFAPLDQRADLTLLAEGLEQAGGRPSYQLIGPKGALLPLPESLLNLLQGIASALAAGEAIAVVPTHRDLTTQQAADLLNVSRQYLIRLLNEGQLPCRRVGTHRRLRLEDVLAYKQVRDKQRREAIRELTRLSQEYGETATELGPGR